VSPPWRRRSPADARRSTIKGPSELKLSLTLDPSSTSVSDLKSQIEEKTQIEADRQRLIYSGKVLKDQDSLSTYKIQVRVSFHGDGRTTLMWRRMDIPCIW
jgi:ubiquilin